MLNISFYLIKLWIIPILLLFIFVIFFLKSLFLLSDYFSSNPFFEKKKLKFNQQLSTFSIKLTPIIFIYYIVVLFTNTIYIQAAIFNYFLIIFFFFIIFLKIAEKIFFFISKKTFNQTINTSNLFLITFIPTCMLIYTADNLINLILPLELLGILFYFIFLEFSYNTQIQKYNKKNNIIIIMRGLLYYFWLNFLGSLLFIFAIAILIINMSSISLITLHHINSISIKINYIHICINILIFLGITLKMGGFFFYFFKIELYKILSMYGVLLFSLYSSIFYLLLLFLLTLQLPFFIFSCKWFISIIIVLITSWLIFLNGFYLKNIYIFSGLSSVLTICFCIFILI